MCIGIFIFKVKNLVENNIYKKVIYSKYKNNI